MDTQNECIWGDIGVVHIQEDDINSTKAVSIWGSSEKRKLYGFLTCKKGMRETKDTWRKLLKMTP